MQLQKSCDCAKLKEPKKVVQFPMGYFLDIRVGIVVLPIAFSALFTLFWISQWKVLKWGESSLPGFPSIENYQNWEDTSITSDGQPARGYPVFTVRTLAVNALGIPTVFFLGAIFAMQLKRF